MCISTSIGVKSPLWACRRCIKGLCGEDQNSYLGDLEQIKKSLFEAFDGALEAVENGEYKLKGAYGNAFIIQAPNFVIHMG